MIVHKVSTVVQILEIIIGIYFSSHYIVFREDDLEFMQPKVFLSMVDTYHDITFQTIPNIVVTYLT